MSVLATGTRLGAYEIVSIIGAGGMGHVYRARDTKLNREVALKVLLPSVANDPDRLARFGREAQLLASLNHPRIAQIYGLEGQDGREGQDRMFLVMELVEGEELAARIARGPLPLADALPIARQILEALEAAHERGVVHRDLKPANIKIAADGSVKVLDFGLAKAVDPTASAGESAMNSPTMAMHATQVGVILGTAAYMSPEQAAGKSVDKRTDIWAFGVVLFEMLTGRQLFDGESSTHMMAAVLTREPDWTALPPNTPASVRTLLRRCLDKDRRHRLADAADARLELDEAIAPARDSSLAARAGRRLWPVTLGLAAAAAVAALGTWAWSQRTPALQPMIRLTSDLGPDAISGPRTTVAISPDGRRIVFPVRSANGTQLLAIRMTDQATATPIPGTEDSEDPFFSPDGEWIGFTANRLLKKIAVRGGEAITLCPADNFRGASWGADGTIVAALGTSEGLSIVPAAGGAPQMLTTPVNGEQTHRYPQILPGGQLVLFTASSNITQFQEATLQVVSLKTRKVTTVARGGYFGRYYAGRLTYVHQGVLYGVPLDLSRLEVRGTPAPLLDDMASNPVSSGGQLDASQTGTFVYLSGTEPSGYPIVWLDRTGRTEPLLAKSGNYVTPRLSPDGKRIAMAMDLGKGRDIYGYDTGRDALYAVTANGHSNLWPVWTNDGTHIVYGSLTDKAIWWTRADGSGEPQRLLESKFILTPVSFSPDGRSLTYIESTVATKPDCWILPLDITDPEHPKAGTPEVFVKTPAAEGAPTFSRDGRWLAYISDETGRLEVYVRPRRAADGAMVRISNGGGGYPFWAPDGKTLYFVAADFRIMSVEYTIAGGTFTIGAPRVWSDVPVRVPTASGLAPLDLAPDGQRFAILPRNELPKGTIRATFLLNFFDELQRRLP